MAKNKKRTVVPTNVQKRAAVISNDPNAYLHKRPVWSFRYARKEENWCVHCLEFATDVIPKLVSFESMSWDMISKQTHDNGRSSNHFVGLESLNNIPRKILSESNGVYNTDRIYSLRLSNKERLIGILEENVFSIIWYDREHEIVRSKKKHT